MAPLGRRLKLAGLSRSVNTEETVQLVGRLAERMGIAQLLDITGLDRLGIPAFRSTGPNPDGSTAVYLGKGPRLVDAMAGALMEGIERQSAQRARPPLIEGTVEELRKKFALVDPSSLVTELREDYSERRVYQWVEGFDLLNERVTMVPARCAGFRWKHLEYPSPFVMTTTHGLSSGNCLEEAVSHSLCEWVERDARTLAEVLCHWRPRARAEALTGKDPGLDFVDDMERFPCLSLDGMGEPVEELAARFQKAGLELIVRDLTSDLGIPVAIATALDDQVRGGPQVHTGSGAHPDLAVAVTRAITEAAQLRCADFQAMREATEHEDGSNTRRLKLVDRRRWAQGKSAATRGWRHVEDYRNIDIFDDIQLILARLRRSGIQQVVIVDLSPPDSNVAVVRALVPGLETWIMDQGRLGERAATHWRRDGERAVQVDRASEPMIAVTHTASAG